MVRITSTHVENTMQPLMQKSRLKDHLHTRGEYRGDLGEWKARMGSPPHTWRILAKL